MVTSKNSIQLHGRRGVALQNTQSERMAQVRTIVSNYSLSKVYSTDKSGLFYRLGSGASYLAPCRIRTHTRVTDFQRHKIRITIVLYVNGDGPRSVLCRYIGHSAVLKCFRNSRFQWCSDVYSNLSNAWTDSEKFSDWIFWCNAELAAYNR